jgi:hypothetical protein
MIQGTKSSASSKQILDVSVICLHESNKVKAFKVSIKEGEFIVLDYSDRFGKTPDTEIYYARYTDFMSPNSKEYKVVNQHVTNFLKSRRDVA